MRVKFKKRTPGRIEFGIIYGVIALFVLCAVRMFPVFPFAPSCVFKGLTGLPCPTCGSTRSVVHLVHGDISGALMMNPLTAMCFIAAILFFLYSLITLVFDLPRVSFILTKKEGNAVRIGAITLLLAQWVYLSLRR
ncbi:MAG: DUF2752 domain-containing protein [Betaproteobacteria bacterium]